MVILKYVTESIIAPTVLMRLNKKFVSLQLKIGFQQLKMGCPQQQKQPPQKQQQQKLHLKIKSAQFSKTNWQLHKVGISQRAYIRGMQTKMP